MWQNPAPLPGAEMYRTLAVSLAFVSLAGCSTSPVSNAEATAVPADRIVSSAYSANRPGAGIVTVKRDSGVLGSPCSNRVYVNGSPIADLRTSEKVTMHLPAGDYMLGAIPNGMCAGGMTELRFTVKAGEPLNFRMGYSVSGDFRLTATAF